MPSELGGNVSNLARNWLYTETGNYFQPALGRCSFSVCHKAPFGPLSVICVLQVLMANADGSSVTAIKSMA